MAPNSTHQRPSNEHGHENQKPTQPQRALIAAPNEAFSPTYLGVFAFSPFDPVDWRRLTTEVRVNAALDRCCASTDISEVYARLAIASTQLGNFAEARRSIETFLWIEMRETPGAPGLARTLVADLANAMLDTGVHQGVPQILAYLRTQPTNQLFNQYLDQIELKLTDMVGKASLLPPAAEPWASAKREIEGSKNEPPPSKKVG